MQLQRLLPQHALSRVVGRFADSTLLARPLIRTFSAAYRVNLADAQRTSIADYTTFNDFFTRVARAGRASAAGRIHARSRHRWTAR